MSVLTVKVSKHLERRLRQHAEASGQTKSAVARTALDAYLDQAGAPPVRPSAFDLMRDHIGSVEGPRDLSTNPTHMAGYGK
jgi:hypothetical protein